MTVKEWLKGLEEPFPFSYFLCSMSCVLICIADRAMRTDYPSWEIDGVEMSGKAVNAPTPRDCAMLLRGGFSARSMSVHQQIISFVRWFLEQSMDEDLMLIYDADKIGEMWNEFAVKGDSGNV